MSNSNSNIRVRPYLSIEECRTILSCIPESEKELREKISILLVKYDAGFIKGSYEARPRASVVSNLGFDSDAESRYLSGEMTPEESAAYEAALLK